MPNDLESLDPVDMPEPEPSPIDAGPDLDAIRALVLRAHPDVVPELIAGETVEALLASVAPAQAAWQRLAERFGAATPPVPAGGARPVAVDPDRLPPGEKIRRGLARSGR